MISEEQTLTEKRQAAFHAWQKHAHNALDELKVAKEYACDFEYLTTKQQDYFDALEYAARSCATCIHYNSLLQPTEYCLEHCRKPGIRCAGWVFDQKRFTKGEQKWWTFKKK